MPVSPRSHVLLIAALLVGAVLGAKLLSGGMSMLSIRAPRNAQIEHRVYVQVSGSVGVRLDTKLKDLHLLPSKIQVQLRLPDGVTLRIPVDADVHHDGEVDVK